MKNRVFCGKFPVGENDIIRSVLVNIVRLSLKAHKFLCHSLKEAKPSKLTLDCTKVHTEWDTSIIKSKNNFVYICFSFSFNKYNIGTLVLSEVTKGRTVSTCAEQMYD